MATDQCRSRPWREDRPRDRQGRPRSSRLYAPMALAGKMGIYDVPETIRTRSILIPMQRRLEDGKVERWNKRIHPVEAEPLRWLLRCWTELIHSDAIDYVGPGRPVLPKGIWNRDADVWEPLLTVAELAGGHWPERARVAAVAAVTATEWGHAESGHRTAGRHQDRLRRAEGRGDLHRRPAGRTGHDGPALAQVGRQAVGPAHCQLRDGRDQQDPAHRRQGHQGLPAGVLRGRLAALSTCGYIGYIGYRRGGRR